MQKLFLLFLVLTCIYLPQDSYAGELDCGTSARLSTSLRDAQSVAIAISQSDLVAAAWSCTKNFFMGVWDSSGGAAGDAWSCITNPIDCANSAVTGVKNAWNFLTNLASDLKNMYESLANLSTQQKVDIICELVGSLGSSVAIGILTAGAAAPLVARVVATLSAKVLKLAQILRRVRGVTPRKLARLSDDVLAKVEELSLSGYGRIVKNAVEACPL